MKKSLIWIIVIVIVVAIGGLWWAIDGGGIASSSATSAPPATDVSSSSAQTIMIGTSASGTTYSEASNGMALYTYGSDTVGTSTCTGDCAITWPPYIASSNDSLVSDPAATGTLSTITRVDGTLQVTYNGMPLYMYAQDSAPGDTNGDGINSAWALARP